MRNFNYFSQKNKGEKTQGKYLIKIFAATRLCALTLILFVLNIVTFAQTETPPTPSAPRSAKIPAIVERKMPSGLRVAVVERKNVPLVTVQLLIRGGAGSESFAKAGLANMTASMLTKGTKTRSASQIAEEMEFLGSAINSGAGWNNSVVTINVMSDQLDPAMAILSDVVLNPAFKQEEIDLLKTQTLDGLAYNLKQPGFLANYVASRYSFGEHPTGGTPESLNGLTRDDIVGFLKNNYFPANAVLVFTGDITLLKANALAQKYFGKWTKNPPPKALLGPAVMFYPKPEKVIKRFLVIDLPNSGQASVNYCRNLDDISRGQKDGYFQANVLNSVLGGGYSSRLNQEIRIKRGLSYGAGSIFAWRNWKTNFSTRTQTKNESAAEVAELVSAEIKRLTNSLIPDSELSPRKLVLSGDFGRDLETTGGLAERVAELYSFNLPSSELKFFIPNVNAVTDAQIKDFADKNLLGGDMIIVGDYSVFKDDLAKRFPGMKIDVIKADGLDLSKVNLQN